MNIYRLEPIDPGNAHWLRSNEKEVVWACAPSPWQARDLVAEKTRTPRGTADEPASPWRSEILCSCVLDPTMTLMSRGTVVRQDGSLVED